MPQIFLREIAWSLFTWWPKCIGGTKHCIGRVQKWQHRCYGLDIYVDAQCIKRTLRVVKIVQFFVMLIYLAEILYPKVLIVAWKYALFSYNSTIHWLGWVRPTTPIADSIVSVLWNAEKLEITLTERNRFLIVSSVEQTSANINHDLTKIAPLLLPFSPPPHICVLPFLFV